MTRCPKSSWDHTCTGSFSDVGALLVLQLWWGVRQLKSTTLCLVCFFPSFMTWQITVLAYCGATQGCVGTKGRRESLTGGSGRLDCPSQLQLWLGQPQQNPNYSITFSCQETKEAWLRNKVQQNVKRPFSTTGHHSSVLSVLALICTLELMQRSSPPFWVL